MQFYQSENNGWKSELGNAATKLLINISTMVPLIGLAFAAALFINQLFSPPFGFTCKSVAGEVTRPAVRRIVTSSRVIPAAKAPSPTDSVQKPEPGYEVEPLY